MPNIEQRSNRHQPPDLAADDADRRIIHQFPSRHDRLTLFGLHSYRSRRYFEVCTAEILPTGEQIILRRTSHSVRTFLAYQQGIDALERALRAEGAL
jgi:hypothetical protein